jgi:hypothetical protein
VKVSTSKGNLMAELGGLHHPLDAYASAAAGWLLGPRTEYWRLDQSPERCYGHDGATTYRLMSGGGQ